MSGINSVSSTYASLSQYLTSLASGAALNALPNASSEDASSVESSASASSSASGVEDTQLASLLNLLQDGAAATTGDGSSTDSSAVASNESAPTAESTSSGGAAGVSLSTLRTQIESAVNSVLGNLSGSALSNPGVAAKAVRAAVDQTLQQDGYLSGPTTASSTTPTSFGGAAGSDAASGSGASSGVGASSASSANTALFSAFSLSAATTESSVLDSLLLQNNVSPDDFQNNLLSALSNLSGSGGADFSQLFQSFPSGQDINAIV